MLGAFRHFFVPRLHRAHEIFFCRSRIELPSQICTELYHVLSACFGSWRSIPRRLVIIGDRTDRGANARGSLGGSAPAISSLMSSPEILLSPTMTEWLAFQQLTFEVCFFPLLAMESVCRVAAQRSISVLNPIGKRHPRDPIVPNSPRLQISYL